MTLRLQPVQVATKSDDTESQLVFADGFLVAILVRLSDQHEDDAGKWFLEAGFGRVDPICPPVFEDMDHAQAWILDQLSAELRRQHDPDQGLRRECEPSRIRSMRAMPRPTRSWASRRHLCSEPLRCRTGQRHRPTAPLATHPGVL